MPLSTRNVFTMSQSDHKSPDGLEVEFAAHVELFVLASKRLEDMSTGLSEQH
jgi:hypothetical protein